MSVELLCALPISTLQGVFLAHYSDEGLTALEFPSSRTRPAAPASPNIPEHFKAWHSLTRAAVQACLSGKPPGQLPPIAVDGTAFQKSVWREMRSIPLGETVSYGEIADAIGKPRAARAVGQACGANPIPLLIPCHRVLASGGQLGGFSGGLDWKRRLLAIEGVTLL